MDLFSQLHYRLNKNKNNFLLRQRCLIDKRFQVHSFINQKSFINFCSNDYLNIAHHPLVKKAFICSIEQHGTGSGSSPLISGYSKPHRQLEEAFAEFLNREDALLFNSGYHANIGVITTFANRNSSVIADKFCHASLIDGIILSRAKHYRFRHNDVRHAESMIKNTHRHNSLLLLTESVFSIHGDMSDIPRLVDIAEQTNALLVIDDAHGIGVLGENGRGACEHYQLTQENVPCLMTPLGKAFGSFGAIVSGKKNIIEPLVQFARSLHYSTALPPALCDATRAAIHLIQNESWRRKKLSALTQFFIKESLQRRLPLTSLAETPIKAFHVSSNQTALAIQKALAAKSLLIACIRPPTAPYHAACLRISLNCTHTEKQITYLLDCLREQYNVLPHE